MITALIFLVPCMHIKPTKLIENSAPNAKFDSDKKLCSKSTGLYWDNNTKIEEAIIPNKDDKNKEKDPQERNKQLKREKQCQKQAAKAKTC